MPTPARKSAAQCRTHSIGARYEIGDPIYEDVVEHARTLRDALRLAQGIAHTRGHRIHVYDRMARRDQPDLYVVEPTDG